MAARALRIINFRSRVVPYADGLLLQERLAELRRLNQIPDTLVLLQHEPVFTIGKRGTDLHFVVPRQEILARGIAIHTAPRGGEVTYHGPGQLVAYPILALRPLRLGARAYVEALENAVVDALLPLGIAAQGQVPGATGVWVGGRKIAAIGVRVSHGISSHGLALNVTTALKSFSMIVPCGVPNNPVTSVELELTEKGGGDESGGSPPLIDVGRVGRLLEAALVQRLGFDSVTHVEVGEQRCTEL